MNRFLSGALLAPCLTLSLAAPVHADELCAAQTEALLKRVAAEVHPAPSADQLAQMRGIATELCEAHSAQTGIAPAPPGYADWFTYFMLNKQPEKAGNKRLNRLK